MLANNPYIKDFKPKISFGYKPKNRTVRIRITDTCNLNCSYCFEHDTLKRTKYIDEYNLINILENLKKLYLKESRKINLFLWGGEPLLNPNLEWFIYTIRERYHFIENIELHSNLSIKLKENNLFTRLTKFPNLNLTLNSSIHPEYYFNKNYKVLDNLKLITDIDNKLITEVNLMLHKIEDYDKVLKIKDDIINSFESIRPKFPITIIPTTQLIESDYKKLKIIAKDLFEDKNVISSKKNISYIEMFKINVKDFSCNVPKDSFIINTDGEIFWCQNDFLTNSGSGINFFIDFELIKMNFLNVNVCKYTSCNCEHNIYKES